MATAPVKSQPLHNFSLPFLKWGHRHQINTDHRHRRTPSDSTPPPSTATNHRSPQPADHDSDGGSKNESDSENRLWPTARDSFSFVPCSTQKHQTVSAAASARDGGDMKVCGEVDVEESTAKPWNLRPRKGGVRFAAEIPRVSRNGESPEADNGAKSMRLRGFVDGYAEKRKFWISLTREEIEEDVYSMTGSRAARRPKKRPKIVQKQLDNVFPGLYLAGVSVDAYRVNA